MIAEQVLSFCEALRSAQLPEITMVYGPGSPEDKAYIRHVPPHEASGAVVDKALGDLGFRVRRVSPSQRDLLRVLRRSQLVFFNTHGEMGECGRLQGLLDLWGIPYTGSGLLSSAVALNKDLCKHVARSLGQVTPFGVVVNRVSDLLRDSPVLGWPRFIKPVRGGSSVGARLLVSPNDVGIFLDEDGPHDLPMLVEEYVPGRDVTIAALIHDGVVECLPPLEIVLRDGQYYSETAKMVDHWRGLVDYVVPAEVESDVAKALQESTRSMCLALGARGALRLDFRVGPSGQVVFIEANTNPGLSRAGNLTLAAESAGIQFEALLGWIVGHAAYDDPLSGSVVRWLEI